LDLKGNYHIHGAITALVNESANIILEFRVYVSDWSEIVRLYKGGTVGVIDREIYLNNTKALAGGQVYVNSTESLGKNISLLCSLSILPVQKEIVIVYSGKGDYTKRNISEYSWDYLLADCGPAVDNVELILDYYDSDTDRWVEAVNAQDPLRIGTYVNSTRVYRWRIHSNSRETITLSCTTTTAFDDFEPPTLSPTAFLYKQQLNAYFSYDTFENSYDVIGNSFYASNDQYLHAEITVISSSYNDVQVCLDYSNSNTWESETCLSKIDYYVPSGKQGYFRWRLKSSYSQSIDLNFITNIPSIEFTNRKISQTPSSSSDSLKIAAISTCSVILAAAIFAALYAFYRTKHTQNQQESRPLLS
jgi:hypothetical protein